MFKKFSYLLFAVAALVAAVPSFAQVYANEAVDWGIQPTTELSTTYEAKTPTTVPGAKTILTEELKQMLDGPSPPLLFDVMAGDVAKRRVIPSARLLGFAAGQGNVFHAEKAWFAEVLDKATGGDKTRPMVFYCLGSKCWLSYNAALRAISEGYTNVMWHRGGIAAWLAAGYPLEKPTL